LYEWTNWRPFAKNYRLAVGITEVVCGAILVLIPGLILYILFKNQTVLFLGRLKQLANLVLLIIMTGAVYTHFILGDKFERMAPGLVFALLLLTRLIIHRQVTQREKGSSTEKKVKKAKSEEKEEKEQEEEEDDDEEDEEEEEDVEQGPADQETQSENEDKQKAPSDKKKEKKNK